MSTSANWFNASLPSLFPRHYFLSLKILKIASTKRCLHFASILHEIFLPNSTATVDPKLVLRYCHLPPLRFSKGQCHDISIFSSFTSVHVTEVEPSCLFTVSSGKKHRRNFMNTYHCVYCPCYISCHRARSYERFLRWNRGFKTEMSRCWGAANSVRRISSG